VANTLAYYGVNCFIVQAPGSTSFNFVLQIKTKIVSCHTADSKPVKREVNSTVILPPLVFPALSIKISLGKT